VEIINRVHQHVSLEPHPISDELSVRLNALHTSISELVQEINIIRSYLDILKHSDLDNLISDIVVFYKPMWKL
jgi:hypothetical protein